MEIYEKNRQEKLIKSASPKKPRVRPMSWKKFSSSQLKDFLKLSPQADDEKGFCFPQNSKLTSTRPARTDRDCDDGSFSDENVARLLKELRNS